MDEVIRLYTAKERLMDSLILSIDCLRNGNDNPGIEAFFYFIEDFENVLNIYECIEKPCIIIEKILPEIRTLYTYMLNQDIVGMADLLEYTIDPMLTEMLGGMVKSDYCKKE